MMALSSQRPQKFLRRILSLFISVSFITTSVIPPRTTFAQTTPNTVLNLPLPGTMLTTTPQFTPTMVKGITVHPENPLEFDFIIDTGDTHIQGEALERESKRLIKYFLAALTVPEKDLWVNLSPYEADRIIPDGFGQTEMGRDLLAQDYFKTTFCFLSLP